jgi:hypothetical protein
MRQTAHHQFRFFVYGANASDSFAADPRVGLGRALPKADERKCERSLGFYLGTAQKVNMGPEKNSF